MTPFAPFPAFAPALAVPLGARPAASSVSPRRARAIRVAPLCVASDPPAVTSDTTTTTAARVTTNLPDDDGPAIASELSAFQSLADVEELTELAAEFDLRDLRIVHEGVEVCITRAGGLGFDSDGNLAAVPVAAAPVAAGVAAMPAAYAVADDDDEDDVEDDDDVADVDAEDVDDDDDALDADGDDAAASSDPEAVLDSDFVVTSNRVGFFLSGPKNKPPLVTVGDRVAFNQPVCIIEQLGQQYVYLSEAAGTVVKVFIEDGEAVEFGSDIMVIRPD